MKAQSTFPFVGFQVLENSSSSWSLSPDMLYCNLPSTWQICLQPPLSSCCSWLKAAHHLWSKVQTFASESQVTEQMVATTGSPCSFQDKVQSSRTPRLSASFPFPPAVPIFLPYKSFPPGRGMAVTPAKSLAAPHIRVLQSCTHKALNSCLHLRIWIPEGLTNQCVLRLTVHQNFQATFKHTVVQQPCGIAQAP